MPTCSKSSCCSDKASQAQPGRATIDVAETCSGKVCDEDCIKAAAAIECQSACANHGAKTADHCSKNDNPVFSACAEHLRTAFDKYAILLEQTRCICSRVLEEQKLKCQSDDAASTRSGRSSASIEHGAAVLRQRRNLPCFDKRAVLRPCGTTRSKSSCCASAKQAVPAVTTRGENDLDKSSCCSVGLAATGTTACSSTCGRPPSPLTPVDCRNTATKEACNAIAIKNCGMSPCCDDNVPPKASSDYKTAEGMDLEQASGQEHVVFSVAGMECTGCEGIVHKALGKLPGVSHLRVTFVTATASCDIDSSITSVDEVIRAMQRTTKYKLSRFEDRDQYLDVVSSQAVLDSLASVKGINTMKRLNKTTIRLGYDAAVIGARSILAQCPGASLAPPSRDQALSAETKHLWKILAYAATAAILTLPVLILAWASTLVPEATKQIISLSLATLVQAIAVPVFYNPAISALITSHMIEMDMLVVISITAAYGYSLLAFVIERSGTALETGPFFETSTLLITLVLLGRLIAAYARKTAVASVSLRSLQANMASLVGKDGTTSTIDARLLQFDDTIMIQPSSQIVTDGTIISGTSEVDESMVTGESLPVMKTSGDDVIAGTVNGNGVITIQVTRLPGANTITDIAKLVEQAQSGKPRVQALADKVAGYFIPVVVAISMLVTIVWIAVDIAVLHKGVGAAIGSAITYGIAVLAISCPCALGLAVPMVLVVTGGRAARAGIIIKTADVAERGFKVTDVVFDKTGTLTEDKLAIVEEACLEEDNLSRDQIVGLLKAMVRDNNHPVSKAMSLHLQDRAGTDVEISEITALPGLGVTCLSGDVLYSAGSAELGEVSDHPLVQQMKSQGLTLFCLARGGQLLAVYGLKATARAESKVVIAALQSRHIAVHVVSGDTQQAVDLLAEDLNLPANQAHGRKVPAQKQDYVQRLMSEGKVVLFCGDGTNDAIAVTQADVGVQITPTASDVTTATADVILMSNDLTGVLQLLDISRAAYIRICFNFLWAALYNIFAILLASGAFVRFRIEPAYAGLGEIVSVLPVVLTALTIRKPKRIAA